MSRRPGPFGPVNPFEAGILIIGLSTSLSVIFGFASPTSITQQLSPAFVTLWAVLLLVGSGVALVGLLWPGRWDTGVEIKRPGLVMFALACMAYSYAAARLGSPGLAVSITNGGFCLIALTRVVQVTRGIRSYRRDVSTVRSTMGE